MLVAVCSIKSRVSMVAVLSSTLSRSSSKIPRPVRQGTHLPQVCAWQTFKNASCMSTGQTPGGLAIIRWVNSFISFSVVEFTLSVEITDNLLIVLS